MNLLEIGEAILLIFALLLAPGIVGLAAWFVFESINEERARNRAWTGKSKH